ncbi:universal stress protein, partial [Burkholderia pseudomallei]|uniref:universal stress protein n=1 Tax=Burkholderia pseudomallei TaxID=28450 RepID=UPI001E2AA4B1
RRRNANSSRASRSRCERALARTPLHPMKIVKPLAISPLTRVYRMHGRRGVRRLMLGSVAERLLRHARCPVLMIPARGAPAADANATHPTETA